MFFFDKYYNKGTDYYRNHFNIKKQHKMAMEITTMSFADTKSPDRIFATLGNKVNLVCPLRHPVKRSYSLYIHYKRYGFVKGDLRDAVNEMPEIIETSRYADHLERWFDVFGRNAINICYQEKLEHDQDAYVQDICNALRIPYIPVSQFNIERANYSTQARSYHIARAAQITADWLRDNNMYGIINTAKAIGLKRFVFGEQKNPTNGNNIPDADKAFLEDVLMPEVEKFEKLIGQKVSHWS